jgi:membrane-bound inhibitor of C-type lysozyme
MADKPCLQRRSATCLLACALAALSGCASDPEDEPKTTYYKCGDTARFGVTPVAQDRIELSRSPNRYTLQKVESASGVKYASPRASFAAEGEEAVIEVGDKRWTCTFDRVQASPDAIGNLQQMFMLNSSGGKR